MVQDIRLDGHGFIYVSSGERCRVIHIGDLSDWPSFFPLIENDIPSIISHESLHRAIFVLHNSEEEYEANRKLDFVLTSTQRYNSDGWAHPKDLDDDCGITRAFLRRLR
jgi:hypothetical protein